MKVEAFNAISNPADLGDFLIRKLGLREAGEPGTAGA
jgi:hypothetical protein